MPGLRLVQHALVLEKMARLRDRTTPPAQFFQVTEELSFLLAFEVFKDLPTVLETVQTPLETVEVPRLKGPGPALIPVLRAGLGLVEGFRRLLPTSVVGHLGMYRDETSLTPVQYFGKLPPDLTARRVVVLDPMLATGGSACAALAALKRAGAKELYLAGMVAAPVGVQRVLHEHPDVDIVTCVLDRELNQQGYIVPGLGDAGDRLYGTPSEK